MKCNISDFSLLVEKVSNGYIIRDMAEPEPGFAPEVSVIEEEDPLETMQDVLYYIMEHFGVRYSKHNKKNLVVEIREQEE